MKVLEWSQQISHCKSMQTFYDAQWKLTPQSISWFYFKLKSSKLLWLSLLPARMKKIQSKMKELEWSQHYSLISRCSRGANSKMCDGILTKFKLIQALIVVHIVCKNEEDPIKIERTRVVTTFLPL